MKKLVVIAAALLLAAAPAANAQGALGKLKEKAASAVSGAINDKISEKISEKVGGMIGNMTGIDLGSTEEQDNSSMSVSTGRETLQPKRSSSFGWSGKVTPSSAQFPIPLMNEFPAVPSAAKLANPTEEDQIAYYKAIKAVTLRAEELNADTTCEDNFTEEWRKKAEQTIMDAFGITAAEMKAMDEGTLTPAQEEAIQQRIVAKVLGGVDLGQLQEQTNRAESMTENDIMSMSMAASEAVFKKHDAELKKYFNVSADEYIQATRESMKSNSDKASRDLEKKAEAHIKTLDAATQNQAKAFQKTLQNELMQAQMNAIPGAGLSMQVSRNMGSIDSKMAPLQQQMNKTAKYVKDIEAAYPSATWSDADAKFSDAERKKIESIKTQIYATDKPEEYNKLYLQALDMIKTYRERAAKVWASDVQKRFNKVKDGMGDLIKIQRQAVADEVIPECALYRVPLNLVIEAGDILAEAYSEFPCNYPVMYSEEVVREVKLQEGEAAWWPEFFVADQLDDVLAGKVIFKEKDGKIYQFNKGQWSQVPEDYGKDMVAKTSSPKSASFKSSDDKREVIFNADGGFLQFPEGDIVYPAVWEKRGNEIIWAENETVYDNNGNAANFRIVKCTYKL
ncbi:MAG: hypothetical protein MJY94_06420 [Bacteroidales bacterium]|nr:hypothetical protein [Bacteroidales bacterium]